MSEYVLAGHELESPLVSAAGSISLASSETILRGVDELTDTGIGAITLGSFTLLPRVGNEVLFGGPVYHHETSGRTYNSVGLPNVGLTAAVELAPEISERAHDRGKIVIFGGSPSAEPELGNSVDQAVRLTSNLLATEADLVELSVSCPNIVLKSGGRKPILGYDLDAMQNLVDKLHTEIGTTDRLGLKLPPYLSAAEAQLFPGTEAKDQLVPDLAKILRSQNVFRFLTVCNTIPNQVAKDDAGQYILSVPGGMGGLSGAATKEVGRNQLRLWGEHSNAEIISVLGVDSGKELVIRRQLGAVAAGGVTFLWEAKNPKTAVTNLLLDFAQHEQID